MLGSSSQVKLVRLGGRPDSPNLWAVSQDRIMNNQILFGCRIAVRWVTNFGLLRLVFGWCPCSSPSCQVTEGRASQPLELDMGKQVGDWLLSLVDKGIQGRPLFQKDLSQENSVLGKALAAQCFGLAAGHISLAKSELHQMSCFRWATQGTREVALVPYEEVVDFLQKQKAGATVSFHQALSWASTASLDDFRSLVADCPGSIVRGTIGPKDLLFTPAGVHHFSQGVPGQRRSGVPFASTGFNRCTFAALHHARPQGG